MAGVSGKLQTHLQTWNIMSEKKSCKFVTSVDGNWSWRGPGSYTDGAASGETVTVTNLYILWLFSPFLQTWSVCFVLRNSLLFQYTIYCYKLLWIHGRYPSHWYVAFIPLCGTCVPLTLSSFSFLSFSPCTFGTCHWPRALVHAQRSQNWCFLAIQNSVSVGFRLGIDVHSVLVLRGEGKRENACHLNRRKIYRP
jgi:hypothetical protein